MLKHLLKTSLIGLLCLLTVQTQAQKRVTFTINTAQERKPISPLIYGTNDNYNKGTAKRMGGNRVTNYNWESNASNAGRDWFHSSDNYVPWERGVPENEYDVPGAALKYFHNTSLQQNAYSLITLPMAKYVTGDKNGSVTLEQKAPSNRWKYIRHKKGSPYSLTPNLADDTVYTDEEVNFLIHNFGKSNTPTGVKAYQLDNEPGIWFETHSRMWGTDHLPVDFLMKSSYEVAAMVKKQDPTAEIFGPASWGVSEFEDLQGAPDWHDLNQGKYRNFISYYLANMKAKQEADANKTRLLDVLTLHWYPQGRRDGYSPFDNGTDYFTNKARMEMTRSLWDPTYIEPTWIGEDAVKVDQFLPFIPKMQSTIAQHYPGTKFAITEYSYMGLGHPSGGIAQADALGIFGKQGMYFASYWGAVIDYIKAGFDIYRDYDGKGGTFGDISIKSSTNDIDVSSVHASVESADESRTHIVAMNKSQDEAITASFDITADKVYKGARVWAFDGNGSKLRQLKNVRVITDNKFEYVIPPLTVCHLVLTEEDLSLYPDFEVATVDPAAGYSDGTADFQIKTHLTDGDNNITKVTADLSQLGGAADTELHLDSEGFYKLDFHVTDGTPSGLKTIVVKAVDATDRSAETTLRYRVIKKTLSADLWNGDAIKKGVGEKFYDGSDVKARDAKIEWRATGGNTNPGSMFMHFIHADNTYNVMTWRMSPNNDPVDARDISDYGFIEFKIKSNAPATSDIEFSIRDASAQLHNSGTVFLKRDGYLNSFNPTSYTTVKIPMSALTAGSEINLDQVWQFNFSVNTASKGFDVWIDDIRVLPYSHPYKEPKISDLKLSRLSGYADDLTQVTVSGVVEDPDNNLKQVTVDLSELSGSNHAPMTLQNGRYAHTFTVPNTVAYGTKQLKVTAMDSLENATDAKLNYKVNQVASMLVLWDGETKNTGKGLGVNDSTMVTVDSVGGNKQPIGLNFRMHKADAGFAGAMWDWNENTQNTELQDLSDKRYLNFYIKVNPPRPDYDMEIYLKDVTTASTSPFKLKERGWVTNYTGNWQLVRVPLRLLFDENKMDPTQVARFGLLSNQFDAPFNFKVDDIFATGSIVADVKMKTEAAQCGNNGSITIESVAGQSGTMAYFIDGVVNPAGINNPVFSGLAPGKYVIRITGADDFVYMEEVIITGTGGSFTITGTVTPGNVETQVSGGSGNYTYLWSNGATTPNLTNVPAGTYILTVIDQTTSCQATYTAVVEGNRMAYKVTDAQCSPNGKIIIENVPGTKGALTYYINGMVNPAGAANPEFSNLKPAIYTIKVVDTTQISQEVDIAVGGNLAPTLAIVAQGGNIDLTVNGGSGQYTYSWSNGATTQDLTNVKDGSYTVTVTDLESNCTAMLTIVSSTKPGNPVFNVTDAACAPNGIIRVTGLSDALVNLRFYINSKLNPAGDTVSSFANLKPGIYTIKVTATGYSYSAKATVGGSASAPVVTGVAKDGNVDITVKGGSGIYIYEWSDGSTTQDLMEIPDGTYTVKVTDAATQCITSFSIT
ncbi:MAG: glycoside hydrolase family 44 protein, partial [Bacteroidota bacterium]